MNHIVFVWFEMPESFAIIYLTLESPSVVTVVVSTCGRRIMHSE